MNSVYTERCQYAPTCLRMVWKEQVNKGDMNQAFNELHSELDSLDEPQNVIVFLDGRVRLPLTATTVAALSAHKHQNLKAWLVVSEYNALAQAVANTLSAFSGNKKILWFKSEDEIKQYLTENGHFLVHVE